MLLRISSVLLRKYVTRTRIGNDLPMVTDPFGEDTGNEGPAPHAVLSDPALASALSAREYD